MNPISKAEESKNGSQNKPIILREGEYSEQDLTELKESARIWKTVDLYESQLIELFKIEHPHLTAKDYPRDEKKNSNSGNWIYFPWSGVLVHSVTENDYFSLRTNRNRELTTVEEQKKLAESCIALVGLSVGSHVATGLSYAGIGNHLKLAEFDTLDTTNLNRVRARIDQIGSPKAIITAQQIYEINPYAQFDIYPEGINTGTLKSLVADKPKPKIIFEIMDSFEMKIHLRIMARKERIPVIQFANLGDSILVDVERYDLDPNLPLFNGRAGKTPEDILQNPDLTDTLKHKYAVDLVGIENIPERAMQSVKEIGKTLVGRPQLMSTVTISGGLGVYFAKEILLGHEVKSGRVLLRFSDFLS